MMKRTELDEKDSNGDYYTWSNKHIKGIIYFRIGRVLRNLDWHQQHSVTNLKIMEHLLCLKGNEKIQPKKKHFKFQNAVIEIEGFQKMVADNWNQNLQDTTMYILWRKLQSLQPIINSMSKPINGVQMHLEKARKDLSEA